ncbi:hypothetical protein H8959_018922, partial [Pygathrix nigripes]
GKERGWAIHRSLAWRCHILESTPKALLERRGALHAHWLGAALSPAADREQDVPSLEQHLGLAEEAQNHRHSPCEQQQGSMALELLFHPWRWHLPKAIFTLLLGPFTFFDVQKTKYLQILTSLMRWIAFAVMIVLALVRIGHGQGEGHPPLADFSGVRNLFGVCVYSFMCQHSLPSLITPVSSKRHLTRLVFLDYLLILAFYGLLSFTAIFCFRGDSLMDMYTLNFARCDVVRLAAVRFFLGLFPVFTISTNFPIIAVTLRNNWKTLFHREGGTYPWVVDRVVFPTITLVPPVLVAFCTHDLESLVGITGAYAGTGIQYVIPAFLVYHCRRDTQLAFGCGVSNKHRSPFRHTFWVGFVLLWAFSCFIFVTANIVLSETKL